MHLIAGQWADAFIAVLHVGCRNGVTVLQYRGETVLGVPTEVTHQIQDMGAEDPKIFTTPTSVIFPANPVFDDTS